MAIHRLNKTGLLHDIHTEDHVFIQELDDNWTIGAVMDGCSSGIETYFASTLYGKIIRKSLKGLLLSGRMNPKFNLDKLNADQIGSFILNQIFNDLAATHKLLETDLIEMLATLLLLVYHKKNKSAWINISGDGLIVCNHQIIEIDQNNIPDYMAYHLDITFDQWIERYSKTYSLKEQTDISISTDGISKFITQNQRRPQSIDPLHYLLVDDTLMDSGNMLESKYKILEQEHGLIPYDDLGIIRIINK
jgi:hypothetical protein